MHALTSLLGLYLATLVLTLALTVPAYSRLIRAIAEDHPEDFERMRRPSMLSASIRKSIALQNFIYNRSREPDISQRVRDLSRYVGWVTPLMLVILTIEIVLMLAASFNMLQH